MDYIWIKELEVFANHGVLPEEQKLGQKFVISVKLKLDTWRAAAGDDLCETINYADTAARITAFEKEHPVKLLETAANDLAIYLLNTYPVLKSVEVCIEKPWAPIGLPLSAASVTVERSWHEVYIGLGSNLGDSKEILKQSISAMERHEKIQVISVSDQYITKPYGVTDQPDFVNQCIGIKTICEPVELLAVLNRIEAEAGRERLTHWGPRTLDLDILLYDNLVLGTKQLTLPHPRMNERMFVLEPLSQIAPWLIHPVTGETIADIRNALAARTTAGVDEGTIVKQA